MPTSRNQPENQPDTAPNRRAFDTLDRSLGVPGAVMIGMGSIVGTGAFVSIGIAAGIAGPAVLLAIAIAAALATCNGLSSAQLAANHAVSGGTYEYGYRYASPFFGFLAGWMFLIAKSASAATAALGLAGYLLITFRSPGAGGEADGPFAVGTGLVPIALLALVLLTTLTLTGLRRTNLVNIIIVTITLLTLVIFVLAGLPAALDGWRENFTPFIDPLDETTSPGTVVILHATALMFVAYTGYGRIATMGEEVREPRRIIPRAIIITLIVSMLLYLGVAFVAIGAVGAAFFAESTSRDAAPLDIIARTIALPGAGTVLAIGAITAMTGVLLNLLLGLSRVLLAMGRRGDMPRFTATLSRRSRTPAAAILVVALIIGALVLIGDVRTTWSFSAFTVLIYYAITNWCALQLPRELQLFPRWIAALGLVGCLALAFFVDWQIWAIGLGLTAAGWGWMLIARTINARSSHHS